MLDEITKFRESILWYHKEYGKAVTHKIISPQKWFRIQSEINDDILVTDTRENIQEQCFIPGYLTVGKLYGVFLLVEDTV